MHSHSHDNIVMSDPSKYFIRRHEQETLLRWSFASPPPQPQPDGLPLTVVLNYAGADKSLARPERKQATAREDFEFHISYL